MGEVIAVGSAELQPTGHICADCGNSITYSEEVWLLQIVQPQRFSGRTFHHQVIDEEDLSGDFLFDPYFYCFSCWENMYKELQSEATDEPPIEDPGSAFECVCCGSGIREWEYAGIFTLGEFHVSTRAPNGVRGPHFVPNSQPDMLCLYCLVLLNEGHITMWEYLAQFGECNDCIQLRCWREGIGHCTCSCHLDEPEDSDAEQVTGE